MSPRQRVAVVTGGAGGIGASIAEALGREGWYVVTVDPLVTLDGTEQLPEPADSTAARITAAGGSARASSASVTDAAAVRSLFDELAADHGGLDAVVNVAGITRQSYFARGTEEDWAALLEVHLGGYLNVLEAALPLMAEAGHGRILGITSGSGWRAADAGGYSAAKRAVAALTWQLGRAAPPGVTVNALSPIANTRMVAAAFERARAAGRAGGGGGLTLDAIPGPENLGPLGAYLVGDECGWCSGQVFFAGGPEVAVVDQPRLVEVVRTDDVVSLAGVLEAVLPRAFVAAEANQATDGGANPRFGSIFDDPAPAALLAGDVRSCAVVSERPDLTAALTAALEARSITCHLTEPARDFGGAAKALGATVDACRADRRGRGRSGRASRRPCCAHGVAGHSGRPPRARRAPPCGCVLDPCGRRVRGGDRAPRTDRHADRRHDAGGPEPGAGLGAARPGRWYRDGSPRHRAGGERGVVRAGRARDDGRAGRASSRSPGGRRPRRCGAGRGDRVDRPAGPPPTDRHRRLRRARDPRVDGRCAPPDRRRPRPEPATGGPMTDGEAPVRVVDAHVHLWDPARTDWYPYLSRPGREGGGSGIGGSGMYRRFDADTYRAESARWNVEKFVNVAAATGPNSIDETLELDRNAPDQGGPAAIIGGLPPTETVAEAVALLDRQMAASRFRGVRPMGPLSDPVPDGAVLGELRDRQLIFELMAHPDQLAAAAARLAAFPDLTVVVEHTGWPRTNSDEERALWQAGLSALAALGDHVVCKLSGLSMPFGSMQVEAVAPWLEFALDAFGADRCMFASNFPVDSAAGSFDDLYTTFSAVTSGLDAPSREKVFAATAERIYRI